jgi:hypothetical protein
MPVQKEAALHHINTSSKCYSYSCFDAQPTPKESEIEQQWATFYTKGLGDWTDVRKPIIQLIQFTSSVCIWIAMSMENGLDIP